VVRKDFPADNLKEFVAYAKANEAKLNVGHAGLGSVSYIGCLLLHSAIGIKPAMVPFTGTAPVLNAMLGGEIDYECDPVLGTLEHVRAGTVKALAVAAKKRSPLLPDVPTSYEQGLPEFDCAPFYGIFAPAARRSRSSRNSPTRSTRASTRRPCKSGLANSAPISSSRTAADPRRWGDLVSSETARLMPVLKAAAAK